jgi:hypothetical protein
MKFCGMCGAALPAPLAEEPASMPARILPADEFADREVAAAAQRPATPSAPAPAHTGGAFRLMGQDVDPGARSLDYLLEDDEHSESGGRGWLLGIVLALALAGGLGYWHYRNGGFSVAKPAAGTTTDATAASGSNPSDNPVASSSAPPAGPGVSPSSDAGSATSPTPPTGALTDVRPQNPAEAPAVKPEATAKPDVVVTAPPAATKTPAQDAEATAVPTKATRTARPQAPVKAEDPVTLGEKYIYGRGVPQSCDRGLKMVKPAADQSNGKAMITMGALYATGHCVTRDLPTAYRYFALALRKDPENAALKQNAEMVWGQMTQSERQQAIRLTQ